MPLGQIDGIEAGMLVPEIWNARSVGSREERGWYFSVRNQLFHGTRPLGWFGWVAVDLDGVRQRPSRTFLVLRNQWVRVDQMATISDIYWNKTELAKVFVEAGEPVSTGVHSLACTIGTSVQAHTRAVDTIGLKARGEIELKADATVAGTDRVVVRR